MCAQGADPGGKACCVNAGHAGSRLQLGLKRDVSCNPPAWLPTTFAECRTSCPSPVTGLRKSLRVKPPACALITRIFNPKPQIHTFIIILISALLLQACLACVLRIPDSLSKCILCQHGEQRHCDCQESSSPISGWFCTQFVGRDRRSKNRSGAPLLKTFCGLTAARSCASR